MTKKEYLESLGYEYNPHANNYILRANCETSIYKCIDINKKIYWLTCLMFQTQEDIDNLQIAFNNLKQDFEECMKYE